MIDVELHLNIFCSGMNKKNLFLVYSQHHRCLTDSRKANRNGYLNLLKEVEINVSFHVLSNNISYIPINEDSEFTCTIRDIKVGVVLANKILKKLIIDTLTSLNKCGYFSRNIHLFIRIGAANIHLLKSCKWSQNWAFDETFLSRYTRR